MVNIITIITSHTLLVILTLILSALPLYLSIKLVKGHAGIVKIILIGILLSFVSLGATSFIGIFAGLFMLIATLFIYKLAFKISFTKAFIAWILQYIFVFLAIAVSLFFLSVFV